MVRTPYLCQLDYSEKPPRFVSLGTAFRHNNLKQRLSDTTYKRSFTALSGVEFHSNRPGIADQDEGRPEVRVPMVLLLLAILDKRQLAVPQRLALGFAPGHAAVKGIHDLGRRAIFHRPQGRDQRSSFNGYLMAKGILLHLRLSSRLPAARV